MRVNFHLSGAFRTQYVFTPADDQERMGPRLMTRDIYSIPTMEDLGYM